MEFDGAMATRAVARFTFFNSVLDERFYRRHDLDTSPTQHFVE